MSRVPVFNVIKILNDDENLSHKLRDALSRKLTLDKLKGIQQVFETISIRKLVKDMDMSHIGNALKELDVV